MGSATRPRGRLPQSVYWRRRAMVLALGLLLVFGIGKIVGGLGSDPDEQAVTAATTTTPQASVGSTTAAVPTTTAAPVGPVAPPKKALRHTQTPLATPTGDCAADEVTAMPTVPQAAGGGDIPIILQLVGTQPACNFQVSAKTLVVKVTKGENRFWSSQDCPEAIPTTQVVVRSGVPVAVPVTWNGRASTPDCKPGKWARAGSYQVYAAALGSAPSDMAFDIALPAPVVKTKTIPPKPRAGQSGPPTGKPSGTPSPTR